MLGLCETTWASAARSSESNLASHCTLGRRLLLTLNDSTCESDRGISVTARSRRPAGSDDHRMICFIHTCPCS
eukprot:7010-Eustigmatos_ZCMA.PRE.1